MEHKESSGQPVGSHGDEIEVEEAVDETPDERKT